MNWPGPAAPHVAFPLFVDSPAGRFGGDESFAETQPVPRKPSYPFCEAILKRGANALWMEKNASKSRAEKANQRRHSLRVLFGMEQQRFEDLPPEEQRYFYRCPACGEMVDNRDLNAIVLHHAHVLHPNRFDFARSRPTSELTR